MHQLFFQDMMKINETNDNKIKRKGLMFVLSSPSGAGKTSLSRKLLELDDELFLSISYTTRPSRPGEIDGEDYFFINNDDFALYAGTK